MCELFCGWQASVPPQNSNAVLDGSIFTFGTFFETQCGSKPIAFRLLQLILSITAILSGKNGNRGRR